MHSIDAMTTIKLTLDEFETMRNALCFDLDDILDATEDNVSTTEIELFVSVFAQLTINRDITFNDAQKSIVLDALTAYLDFQAANEMENDESVTISAILEKLR
jgi:hypothetical protein